VSSPRNVRDATVALAILALLCVALYGRVVSFELTRTDDTVQLVDHARFVADFHNLPAAFAQPFFAANGVGNYYRPIVTLTYMLDAHWANGRPLPYHVTNLGLHLVAAWLFYLLARRLRFTADLALAAAALLLVHPALAEVVAWVPGRGDSLVTIWFMAAMLSILRYRETQRFGLLLAHFVFVLLALFTKEAAVTLPVVVAAYLFFVEDDRATLRRPTLWLGWAFVVGVWAVCWSAATSATADQAPGQRLAALFDHLPVLLMYLAKAVWPRQLAVLAIERDTSWLPGAIALVPMAAAAWWLRGRHRRMFLWGVAAFALLLAPSLPVSNYLILEIRLCAPLVFLLFAALGLAQQARERWPGARAVSIQRAAAWAVVVGCALRCAPYVAAFRNAETFTAQAVHSSPHCALAHVNRGIVYQRSGRAAEAEAEYAIAIELDAKHAIAHNNLGLIHLNRGDLVRAEQLFREELTVNPTYDKAHFNLALALARQGRGEEAIQSLHEAVRFNPENADAIEALAGYYAFRGDAQRAALYQEQLRQLGAGAAAGRVAQ
jgi:Tfp pilus assembly protein PilF